MSIHIESNVKDPSRIRERRQQIVGAAVRLFAEKGFHRTTTREISRASGLSNGALYEYVKTKEDVLFLACQHIHQEIKHELQVTHPEGASGAYQLKRAIEGFFDVMRRMQEDILLIYQESKSLSRPYLTEVLLTEEAIAASFRTVLEAGLRDGSLAVTEAAIPLLAEDIVVCGQMWAFRRWALKAVSFEQFAGQQLKMLLQACGAPESVYNNEFVWEGTVNGDAH